VLAGVDPGDQAAEGVPIQVRLSRENTMAVIKISDDGVGGADTAGSGLRGLIDRVEALDGRLYLASPVGGGTIIRAEIPCAS
jgi:signal transduction histidine kinase